MISDTLATARAYVAAGLSVIPIAPDGNKAPDGLALPKERNDRNEWRPTWNPYRSRLATDDELHRWFWDGRRGIGIVGGLVSGGLEVLDFDELGLFDLWAVRVQEQQPGLLELLPQVLTPKGGRHVYYRVSMPDGSKKLARTVAGLTRIEFKGEGGYVLAPGTPAACHPLGKQYQWIAGPPVTEAPVIE